MPWFNVKSKLEAMIAESFMSANAMSKISNNRSSITQISAVSLIIKNSKKKSERRNICKIFAQLENHSLPWIQFPGLKFPFILLFLPFPSKCPATEIPSMGRKFKLGFPGCTGVYRNNIKCPLSASRVKGWV